MSPTARLASIGLLTALGWRTAFAADPAPVTAARYPMLPNAVASFGAVACDGFIYVYGGSSGGEYNSKTSLGTFHRLPVGGGEKWEELPGGPGLLGPSIVSTGGKVYRLGGVKVPNLPGEKPDFDSVADVAVYDPITKKWAEFPSLPDRRSSHDAVAVGSKLVVAGGLQWTAGGKFGSWATETLVCDTAAKEPKWEPIPQPFKGHAAVAAVGTKVFVFEPLTEADAPEVVRKVHVLDVATGKWEVGPAFPGTDPITNIPAICELGGRLYLNTKDRSVFRLNERGDGWDMVGMTTESRQLHRIVPVSQEAFVAIAGRSPSGRVSASVEVVTVGK